MTRPGSRSSDAEDNALGCWIIAAIVLGLIAVTLLAASNTFGQYFAGERVLRSVFAMTVFLAVITVFLAWRHSGHRRYWRKHTDERLASLRESVLAEFESAREAHRLPDTEELRSDLRDARGFVPERPEVEAIARLLESGEREAAADPTRQVVLRPVRGLREVFREIFDDAGGRAVPVTAACIFVCGILVGCAGAATGSGWLDIVGFLSQWGGLATLLRRNLLIVRFGGSFLLAAALTAAILQAIGTKS